MAALLLVILASLAATVAVNRAQLDAQREREVQLLWVGDQYRRAIASYYAIKPQGNGPQQYPEKLEDLLQDKRFPNPVRHLRRLYVDPMTSKADWQTIASQGRIVGINSSSDKVPLKKAGFAEIDGGFEAAKTYQQWRFAAAAVAAQAPGQPLAGPLTGQTPGSNGATAPGAPATPIGGNPAANGTPGPANGSPPAEGKAPDPAALAACTNAYVLPAETQCQPFRAESAVRYRSCLADFSAQYLACVQRANGG